MLSRLARMERSWGITEWLHEWERRLATIPRPHGFLVAEPRPILWRGEWTLYYARKVGVSTERAARAIARILGAKKYSYYGLKDANAIAYQHIALLRPERRPPHVELGDWLEAWLVADRVSKPERGLHVWNAFRIILEPKGGSLACRHGYPFPNYYGPQRFGVCTAQTHEIGALIARGQLAEAERLQRGKLGDFERRIALEALQAAAWNRALARAVREGLIGRSSRTALLSCPRVAGEIRVPALPLPSPERRGPEWWEDMVDEALRSLGVDRRHLKGLKPRLRPAIAQPCTSKCEMRGESAVHVFTLPRGVYATIYLREAYLIDWAAECRNI